MPNALKKALRKFYPQIDEMHLADFKVRILEGSEGTAEKVRALVDSVQYKLSKKTVKK